MWRVGKIIIKIIKDINIFCYLGVGGEVMIVGVFWVEGFRESGRGYVFFFLYFVGFLVFFILLDIFFFYWFLYVRIDYL